MIRQFFSSWVVEMYDTATEKLNFDSCYNYSELIALLGKDSFLVLIDVEWLVPIGFTDSTGHILYRLVDLDKFKLVEVR